jgi:hypothetical protein
MAGRCHFSEKHNPLRRAWEARCYPRMFLFYECKYSLYMFSNVCPFFRFLEFAPCPLRVSGKKTSDALGCFPALICPILFRMVDTAILQAPTYLSFSLTEDNIIQD